jgi:hypothetical protein
VGSADTVQLLDRNEACMGHSVPIHDDIMLGGFTAPFAQPKLQWDFTRSHASCALLYFYDQLFDLFWRDAELRK